MPESEGGEKSSDLNEETLMSALQIVFLILVAGGFLGFAVALGGLQWRLSNQPKARRPSLTARKMAEARVSG
jgi:hypothetical protein